MSTVLAAPPGRRVRALLFAMLLSSVTASVAPACNIPVFRYALERWKPDPCEVIVFHDQEWSELQRESVERILAHTGSTVGGGNANAKVHVVDVRSEDDEQRSALWDELRQTAGVTAPHVLVRTPLGRGRFINHWHGPLESVDRENVFQSPARTEIRKRLVSGHSVVWLLVESPDEQSNRDARRLAEDTFGTLESKVQLPEGIGLPGSELYADVPLVLKFSLLSIDPDDPRETFLVGLLSGLRRQAFEDRQPLFVPVFGRGRALEVIPASDLSAKLMEELTVYLSGACSCQVKEQNPGFDLLIDADWDSELFGDDGERPPDRSAEEGRQRNPTLVPIPPGR